MRNGIWNPGVFRRVSDGAGCEGRASAAASQQMQPGCQGWADTLRDAEGSNLPMTSRSTPIGVLEPRLALPGPPPITKRELKRHLFPGDGLDWSETG